VIIYLTYNDPPSGVYWSQVTDVVDHLNTLGEGPVRLVALVSLRGYTRSRRSILKRCPGAIVLPMVPRAHNWRVNWIWVYLVCKLLRPTGIMARGIFATALALRMRDAGHVAQVCFDARAAYGAEWEEFRVVEDDRLIAESAELEAQVLYRADLRLAVSKALVQHWRDRFNYHGDRHIVIPCTLGRSVERQAVERRTEIREALGWGRDDVVLVYSGTVVGWQSLELLHASVLPWMRARSTNRILFLSEDHPTIAQLMLEFPDQVGRRWVPHQEVRSMLLACDHGLLLRDPCITNRVASPTKFAEYLSAGLSVVISPDVGDFSAMVEEHGLGTVLKPGDSVVAEQSSPEEHERLARFSTDHFSKEAHSEGYRTVLSNLGPVPQQWPVEVVSNAPLVSIVVPSFNKSAYITAMVDTVVAQTETNWELIVVDDASTDDSAALLASASEQDPRIRLIALKQNRGANHCRNLGIAEARGRYIVFLDADDLFAPHCLRERLAVMQGSDLDMAVFTMEVFSEVPGDHGQRWVPDSPYPLQDFFRHKLPWQTMQPIWDRAFLQGLKGFDESFSRHQDVELHTRALLVPGVRYRLFPGEPDCYYRIAEERKVIDPLPLLRRFSDSAVRYRRKFLPAARAMGNADLLLGIIHRTYLQVLLNAKAGRIERAGLQEMDELLFATGPGEEMSRGERFLFRFTRWYNLLPLRVPGINLVVFHMLTGQVGKRR